MTILSQQTQSSLSVLHFSASTLEAPTLSFPFITFGDQTKTYLFVGYEISNKLTACSPETTLAGEKLKTKKAKILYSVKLTSLYRNVLLTAENLS